MSHNERDNPFYTRIKKQSVLGKMLRRTTLAGATALYVTALHGGNHTTHASHMIGTEISSAHISTQRANDTDAFQPSAESQVVIQDMYRLYGTRVELASQWDSQRERLALEPASTQALVGVADGFSRMRELEAILEQSGRGVSGRESIFPRDLRIFTLKGLDGTPGGSYNNNDMRLVVPGAMDLDAPAMPDKDGIQRKERGIDSLMHTVRHETAHKLAEIYPELYRDYTQRFWRANKDGTWTLKDRSHATGYAGEPHPAEFFADILALASSRFGYKHMDAQSRIFVQSIPELRSWVGDADDFSGTGLDALRRVLIPIGVTNR